MFQSTEHSSARRDFLRQSGYGLASIALASLLEADGRTEQGHANNLPRSFDLNPKPSHVSGQAKAVIQLVQTGGPPQQDLFDRKPELQKRDGEIYQIKMDPFQAGGERNMLLGCPFNFRRYGQSGMEMSELIPHIGSIADEICLVRSGFTLHNNHPEATSVLATGKIFSTRPSLGAWVSYALGTENENLPAFVVLRDPDGYSTGGTLLSQSGWLPALYGGTEFNSRGPAIHNLNPPESMPSEVRRRMLDYLGTLNEKHRERYPNDSGLDTRIRNFELAARIQLSATDVMDLSNETDETLKLYGLDDRTIWDSIPDGSEDSIVPGHYARGCLMARRLIEAGVRYVQVFAGRGQPWDFHWGIKNNLPGMCRVNERASAALIVDLKRRGLLDNTIVLWSGEFGRLPIMQERGGNHVPGRDHNKRAISYWLAGGGFQRGFTYGKTDDVGYEVVENRISMPDLFATISHQLGLDHEQVSFPQAGRNETLSDAEATGAKICHDLIG